MTAHERLSVAIDSIKKWMVDHQAPLLVENLAPGATTETLTEAEAAFGFSMPPDLRNLWALHNGQREGLNGFVEHLDLFDTRQALGELEGVLMFVQFLRESPEDWAEAGVTDDEVRSDRWVPFAGRDSDSLVVSGVSGRVFSCGKDSPPLALKANSVLEWAESFAKAVANDDYAVEEGFGDYYLQRRDREKERRDQEREQKRAEAERYRRETPPLTQLQQALARKDGETCREVFERVVAEKTPGVLEQAVQLLFDAKLPPAATATALQVVLNAVTLSRAQWQIVEKGGQLLSNGAITDFAAGRVRAGTPSTDAKPRNKPWWKFW